MPRVWMECSTCHHERRLLPESQSHRPTRCSECRGVVWEPVGSEFAEPPKEAAKPAPSLEAIAERISDEVAKLFYGDISGGKSIQAVALRVLTEYADALKER